MNEHTDDPERESSEPEDVATEAIPEPEVVAEPDVVPETEPTPEPEAEPAPAPPPPQHSIWIAVTLEGQLHV